MRVTIRRAAAALFVSLSIIVSASAQKADDKPSPPSSSPPANKDAKKYVEVGRVIGKLEKVNTASSEAVLQYHVGRTMRNETLTLADDVKVWHKNPPKKVDENGNSKELTPAEKDKIKSHSGPMKGLYAGEPSDLHAGQQVQVILGKPKDAVKKPAPQKGAAPEKEFVYVTNVVVITDESAPTTDRKKP